MKTESMEQPWFRTFYKGDFLGMSIVVCIVFLAFFEIAFMGKTFSVSADTVGVNGLDPPTGYVGARGTFFRLDPGASAWQMEPWAEVTNRILREGQVPLWNPYKGLGAPHAANMQSAVFDPLLLLVNLHPTPLTWDLTFLLAYFMGALSMYLLCRLLGLRTAASIVGAVGFVLSGYFILYSNNAFFRSYMYLPILFILVELAVVAKRWVLPVAGLGLAIAGNILIGMPEASFLVLVSTAAYVVYRMVGRPKWLRLRVVFARFVVSGLLGLALASPVLLPFAQYEKHGYTVHSPSEQVGARADPKAKLIYWLIPYLNGTPGSFFLESGAVTRNWTGMALAILALVGLSSLSVMREHKGWFFVGLGAVIILKSYDFSWMQWLGKLPITERVNFPAFGLPVAGFCLAFVGAVGTHSLLEGRPPKSRLVTSILLFFAGIVWLLIKNHEIIAATMKPVKIIFLPGEMTLRPLMLTAGFAAVVTAAMIVVLFLLKRHAGILAASMVCVELLLLAPHGAYFNRYDPFVTPPWMKIINRGLKEEPYSRVLGLDAKLFPETAGALGLYDISFLDAIYPSRYVKFIRSFLEPEFYSRFIGGPIGQDERKTIADIQENKMFDLLGVRYILAGDSSEKIQKTFRPIGSAAGVQVFENDRRLPRTFLVNKIHAVRDINQALEFLKETGSLFPDGAIRVERFDPLREAVVETSESGAIKKTISKILPLGNYDSADSARIVSYTANKVKISVRTSSPSLLVLTDTFFPGWVATVNNRPVPILPTDMLFRGVPVNAGTSTVVFSYRPTPFRTGVRLAAIAALIMSCMLLMAVNRFTHSARTAKREVH